MDRLGYVEIVEVQFLTVNSTSTGVELIGYNKEIDRSPIMSDDSSMSVIFF